MKFTPSHYERYDSVYIIQRIYSYKYPNGIRILISAFCVPLYRNLCVLVTGNCINKKMAKGWLLLQRKFRVVWDACGVGGGGNGKKLKPLIQNSVLICEAFRALPATFFFFVFFFFLVHGREAINFSKIILPNTNLIFFFLHISSPFLKICYGLCETLGC